MTIKELMPIILPYVLGIIILLLVYFILKLKKKIQDLETEVMFAKLVLKLKERKNNKGGKQNE